MVRLAPETSCHRCKASSSVQHTSSSADSKGATSRRWRKKETNKATVFQIILIYWYATRFIVAHSSPFALMSQNFRAVSGKTKKGRNHTMMKRELLTIFTETKCRGADFVGPNSFSNLWLESRDKRNWRSIIWGFLAPKPNNCFTVMLSSDSIIKLSLHAKKKNIVHHLQLKKKTHINSLWKSSV